MPIEGAPAAFTTLTHWTVDGDYVEILDVTGEALYFLADGAGGWLAEPGAEGMTLGLAARVWTLTDLDETTHEFADAGANILAPLLEATPPAGSGVSYGYDGQGRLVSVTDPTGQKTFNLEYGANGKLVRVRGGFDANTIVVEYGYDVSGHLVSVTDPRIALVWGYGYSAGGHLLTSITPPGQTSYMLSYLASPTGRLGVCVPGDPGRRHRHDHFRLLDMGGGSTDHDHHTTGQHLGSPLRRVVEVEVRRPAVRAEHSNPVECAEPVGV